MVALALTVAVATAPAAARRDTPDPFVTPTLRPLYDLASPPPTVNAPAAADACGDDTFLSYRAVPMPIQREVTICGLVTSGALAEPPVGRGAPGSSFFVDVDGTQPIAVQGASASANVGDIVVVRGRYHRDNGGGEGIDSVTSAGARGWSYDGYVMVNGTLHR